MSGVVCGRCGVSNPEGVRFCENCDRFLGWDGTAVQPESAPSTRTQAAVPTPVRIPTPAPTPAPEPEYGPEPASESEQFPLRGSGPRAGASGSSSPRHVASERSAQVAPRPEQSTLRLLPLSGLPSASSSTICSNCGRENDPGRRFCSRCGDWLVVPSATATPAVPVTMKDRWQRRWFGERSPYSGSLSRSTIGFRVLVGVVAATVLTAILGLANVHPIQRVKDQVGHVRGTGKVAGLTAAVQPSGGQPDPTASWAVDDVRERGWSTQWTATTAGDPDAACQSASGDGNTGITATSLAIAFPNPIDVREIGIEAGLVKPNERNDRWQPKTLELRWKNGECQSINLKNTADLQRFRVGRGLVNGVVITVVAGYPPVDPGIGRLDIGEITIWKR